MAITARVVVLVSKCFSAAEMDYLNKKPEFKDALAAIHTFNDLEKLTELGQHLLDLQDESIREVLIMRPSSRGAPNRGANTTIPTRNLGLPQLDGDQVAV